MPLLVFVVCLWLNEEQITRTFRLVSFISYQGKMCKGLGEVFPLVFAQWGWHLEEYRIKERTLQVLTLHCQLCKSHALITITLYTVIHTCAGWQRYRCDNSTTQNNSILLPLFCNGNDWCRNRLLNCESCFLASPTDFPVFPAGWRIHLVLSSTAGTAQPSTDDNHISDRLVLMPSFF